MALNTVIEHGLYADEDATNDETPLAIFYLGEFLSELSHGNIWRSFKACGGLLSQGCLDVEDDLSHLGIPRKDHGNRRRYFPGPKSSDPILKVRSFIDSNEKSHVAVASINNNASIPERRDPPSEEHPNGDQKRFVDDEVSPLIKNIESNIKDAEDKPAASSELSARRKNNSKSEKLNQPRIEVVLNKKRKASSHGQSSRKPDFTPTEETDTVQETTNESRADSRDNERLQHYVSGSQHDQMNQAENILSPPPLVRQSYKSLSRSVPKKSKLLAAVRSNGVRNTIPVENDSTTGSPGLLSTRRKEDQPISSYPGKTPATPGPLLDLGEAVDVFYKGELFLALQESLNESLDEHAADQKDPSLPLNNVGSNDSLSFTASGSNESSAFSYSVRAMSESDESSTLLDSLVHVNSDWHSWETRNSDVDNTDEDDSDEDHTHPGSLSSDFSSEGNSEDSSSCSSTDESFESEDDKTWYSEDSYSFDDELSQRTSQGIETILVRKGAGKLSKAKTDTRSPMEDGERDGPAQDSMAPGCDGEGWIEGKEKILGGRSHAEDAMTSKRILEQAGLVIRVHRPKKFKKKEGEMEKEGKDEKKSEEERKEKKKKERREKNPKKKKNNRRPENESSPKNMIRKRIMAAVKRTKSKQSFRKRKPAIGGNTEDQALKN